MYLLFRENNILSFRTHGLTKSIVWKQTFVSFAREDCRPQEELDPSSSRKGCDFVNGLKTMIGEIVAQSGKRNKFFFQIVFKCPLLEWLSAVKFSTAVNTTQQNKRHSLWHLADSCSFVQIQNNESVCETMNLSLKINVATSAAALFFFGAEWNSIFSKFESSSVVIGQEFTSFVTKRSLSVYAISLLDNQNCASNKQSKLRAFSTRICLAFWFLPLSFLQKIRKLPGRYHCERRAATFCRWCRMRRGRRGRSWRWCSPHASWRWT